MNSNAQLDGWTYIWLNKIAFIWSFLFASAAFALAFLIAIITNSKEIEIIASISILTPLVIFLYYQRPPEKGSSSLVELMSNVAHLVMAQSFGIFILWLLVFMALHPFENIVSLMSIIFMIQFLTGFLISILHGLLPLIKSAKFKNSYFLKLTLTTSFFVFLILINNTAIKDNFGNESAQILLAIALTLLTTLTIHLINKNCSRLDEKLLLQSIKVFLIILTLIAWMRFSDSDQTQQSIEELLTLSTSFLLPVAISFLFSSILVIVDLQIAQSHYQYVSNEKRDAKTTLKNLAHIPVNITFFLIVKTLSIPQK